MTGLRPRGGSDAIHVRDLSRREGAGGAAGGGDAASVDGSRNTTRSSGRAATTSSPTPFSLPARPGPSASGAARCPPPTARSRRPRSSSAASTSSRPGTSTRRARSPRGSRRRRSGSSRSARSGSGPTLSVPRGARPRECPGGSRDALSWCAAEAPALVIISSPRPWGTRMRMCPYSVGVAACLAMGRQRADVSAAFALVEHTVEGRGGSLR